MSMKKGEVKGFTIIETMLFLALTGLMLIGALTGIGTNIARQRYKDSVQDIVTMIRSQYDYVTRVQIQPRDDQDVCNIISGDTSFVESEINTGRGRSDCNIYGIALFFGLDDDSNHAAGAIVQSAVVLGKDIQAFEKEIAAEKGIVDVRESIAALSNQELLTKLKLNNIIERNNRCENVNLLQRKVLNWGSKIEDVEADTVKKGIVLIIRSPRDGTVHTFTYDFSDTDIEVLDYADLNTKNIKCDVYTLDSVDINKLLEENKFTSSENFDICITSDDLTGTYGRRRMIRIRADGHNSSAVSLIDLDSEEDICQ